MVKTKATDIEKVWEYLEEVTDPEIPVLSVVDLGVVRDVQIEGEQVQVTITPTYSGCPAMNTIATDIKLKLLSEGFAKVSIDLKLSPAWTTNWLSEAGKAKLEAYGIAPPVEPEGDIHALFGRNTTVRCPLCQSENTRLISQFGSTACKAFYQCNECLEPFDYFKCLK
ncbi:1,2-phenylacetyl-CoA epoxidase subunit PaaD [Pontibacter harenae]|uniref:1,2-phenylacetyl-CoA epoxidase subunit PaaD n=1 Tax=Pontibacter harenae TaxID=2894083 RepID=UPI001E5BC736|nr:1,2-phenylacetyl-CoA epoxidase subunit PaaD [Pontibacter harenae]MCC9167960.1 phenylacetate-CoA oxygenase subunit PaaJ [Pontibacter harenae]